MNATTKADENEVGISDHTLGTMYCSGVLRFCPKCRKHSPKIIHGRQAESGFVFSNRQMCMDQTRLAAGQFAPSDCRYDVVFATVSVPHDAVREISAEPEDGLTSAQREERHRSKMQKENSDRYWWWLPRGRVI